MENSNNLDRYFELFQDILEDHSSGSSILMKKILQSLWKVIWNAKVNPKENLIEVINFLTAKLTKALPQMAPIYYLKDKLEQIYSTVKHYDKAVDEFLVFIEEYSKRLSNIGRNIGENFIETAQKLDSIMTISYSGTVFEVLAYCKRNNGFNGKVFCAESRPVLEGRIMAEKLTNLEIQTTLITDASIAKYISECQAVLIGADRMEPGKIINKTGSLPLAICANYFVVPVYVLVTEDKILTSNLVVDETEHPIKEVWENPPDGIQIRNHYFEAVPFNLIDFIACERGILNPSKLLMDLS